MLLNEGISRILTENAKSIFMIIPELSNILRKLLVTVTIKVSSAVSPVTIIHTELV